MTEIDFSQLYGNQTPHTERHTNLVTPPINTPCWLDHHFERSKEDVCRHVTESEACKALVYYINYLGLVMCYMEPEETIFGQIVTAAAICFICMLFIMSLYYVANYFAVPNAVMLAEYFNLSGQYYGTTIITIVGSMPKLISLIFVCEVGSNNVSVVLAVTFGKLTGIFALGIAMIGFRRHFRIEPKFFFIDSGMLLFGYIYFIVLIYSKHAHDMFSNPTGTGDDEKMGDIFLAPHAIAMIIFYSGYILIMFFKIVKPAVSKWKDTQAWERRLRFQPVHESAPLYIHFMRFLESIDPKEHMKDISRWVYYPTIPIWCFMRVALNVVDLKKPLHDWCKPLKIINILFSPVLLLDFSLPYAGSLVLLISIILAVILMFSTELNKPPVFHWFFALHGLIFSFVLYNVISWEFQSLIFQITEYFFDWTEDIIGLLCLSLFFIASELILVFKFMRNGNYDIAYGLTIGLTIMTLFTALPMIVFNYCVPEGFRICITANTLTTSMFLLLTLVMGLGGILMTGYEIRSSIGAFLLAMFSLNYYYVLLSSSETIHPYGTKHHSHYYSDIFKGTWA